MTKRMLAILLVLVMVLALAACGSSGSATGETNGADANGGTTAGAAATGDLMVGYGRVNITPSYSVPLAGYGNTSMRMSQGYQTLLLSTCIVYSDGEDTVVVFQNDLGRANKTNVDNVRQKISKKYDIPEDHIMISGTHTHSAPDVGNASEPSIGQYRQDLIKWMMEAFEAAYGNMAPVTAMYHGTKVCENLNFVRHYTTEAGDIKGDNLNDLVNSPYTGHTHDADNLMQVVRIDREGADDIILANWQSHPHRGGGSKNYNMTADIVGVMRDYVEKNVDGVQFMYFTGASGNLNPSSRISEENITKDYWEQGDLLGKHAISILEGDMTKLEGTNVQITGQYYTGKTDHREDNLVVLAHEVAAVWEETNDFTKCCELANSYGMNSPYHALAIIGKASLGDTYDVEMYAYSVGDLGFVAAPYEMFDTQGVTIKEESPFGATFVVTCCNDALGYIPSMEGFDNNTYEANNGKFMPGTGEELADEYVKMLETLYATK